MSAPKVPIELWLAALGPVPDEGPERGPLGGFYGYDVDRPDLWPPRGAGPQRAVFWLRWWYDKLVVEGMDVQKATYLHKQTFQDLQSGGRQVMAVHPETGEPYIAPAHFWQSRGEPVKLRSWSGQWWLTGDTETPGDLYMIEPDARPEWWPGQEQRLKNWCAPGLPAERAAIDRLKERGVASPSEKGICRELFAMWGEAGREDGSAASIETTRSRLR